MNLDMQLYWKTFFKMMPNSLLLNQANPIREYKDKLVEGAVLDIGCGQSGFLLEFSTSGRELIAIDNDEMQLDLMKKRLLEFSPENSNKWQFHSNTFPNDKVPNNKYSLIVLSNILHFYSLKDCIKIGEKLLEHCSKGTLIYVCVHSYRHYKNNPNDPSNNTYFKHYFTNADLERVFPKESFEIIYQADVSKNLPKLELEIIDVWLDQSIRAEGYTDPYDIMEMKLDYLQDLVHSNLNVIFRRK